MDSVQSVNNHGTMVMLSPLSGSGKVPLPNGYENGQQMGDPNHLQVLEAHPPSS